MFTALYSARTYYLMRGEPRKALDLTEEALGLAQRSQDPLQMIAAHRAMGTSLYFLGELRKARIHFEHVIASYDLQQHRALAFVHGWDLKVTALCYQAWILWHLGYPDQALQQWREALELARILDHPFSLATGLGYGCAFHRICRQAEAAQRYAEELLTLSTRERFSLLQAWATYEIGWVRAQRGEVEEGIAQMRQGLAGWRSKGTETGVPSYLFMIAEAHGRAGEIEEGLTLVEEALSLVERTEEHAGEADAHRVKGELLQSIGSLPEAEASFRQAIEVARRQEAKSWELRATLSLSRLLQKEGRSAEARQLLSDIYNWFTEGFDTPDLQETRALLEEIRSRKDVAS
jgi:predicted ATPase